MSEEIRREIIAHYEQTRRELLAAIEGLTPEQMSELSFDGWSVKDHLFHLATWDDVRALEVERISAGHDSAWQMTDKQDEDFNATSYDLRKDLSVDQALWELEHTRARLLDAIRNATDRGFDRSLYGDAGLLSGHEEEHAGWIRQWRQKVGI